MVKVTTLLLHDFTMEGLDYAVEVEEIFFAAKSPYQDILIGKTQSFGDALFLDSQIQSSYLDEKVYHETLVQPAMLARPNLKGPKYVLILGGGEGATLREVLKHDSVEKAVMVDIDEMVIKACREHIPYFSSGAFDDPRSKLVIDSASDYLTSTRETFDVIIYDLTDPVPGGPAEGLFTEEFIVSLKDKLNKNGVVALQMGCAGLHNIKGFIYGLGILRNVFGSVFPYKIFMPAFASDWGFVLAFKNFPSLSIAQTLSNQDEDKSKLFGAMDLISLASCFVLPPILKSVLSVS